MAVMVEYPLESGGTVLVAVAPGPGTGAGEDGPVTRGWAEDRSRRAVERAGSSLEAALAQVRPAADALLGSLAGLRAAPDQVTIEFAVQLTAEAGICIGTLSSTANFRISLTWRPGAGAGAPTPA